MAGLDWRRPTGTLIFVVTTFVSQIWSCSAYHNSYNEWAKQHPSWHTVDLKDLVQKFSPVPGDHSSIGRHLQETYRQLSTGVPNGWRTSLVDEGHKFHSKHNLTSMERIRHDAERSRSRAKYMNSRTRTTHFHGSPGTQGRKTLQDTSFHSTVGVTGGGYSMAISLGTPAQNFVAIADTASDLVWLQCLGCVVCFPQPDPFFNPSSSTSYSLIGCTDDACSKLGLEHQVTCTPNCQYVFSYGDQSRTQGDFSKEILTINDINDNGVLISPFLFGCGYHNQGTFLNTDGVVGLGVGPISLPSQLAPFLDNSQKFSYCLVSRRSNRRSKSPIYSPIIFGEAAVPSGVLSYTRLLTPNDETKTPYYYVSLTGITVGSTLLSIPVTAFEVDANGGGGTIFDSGTSFIVLTYEAFSSVANEFVSALPYNCVDLSTQMGLDVCFDVTGYENYNVPKLIFHFENADMDLPFFNYIVIVEDNGSKYICIAIESGGMNIMGNIMQQNYYMLYDVDNLQIGFGSVDCSTV